VHALRGGLQIEINIHCAAPAGDFDFWNWTALASPLASLCCRTIVLP